MRAMDETIRLRTKNKQLRLGAHYKRNTHWSRRSGGPGSWRKETAAQAGAVEIKGDSTGNGAVKTAGGATLAAAVGASCLSRQLQ
jgi:hypothetical protein